MVIMNRKLWDIDLVVEVLPTYTCHCNRRVCGLQGTGFEAFGFWAFVQKGYGFKVFMGVCFGAIVIVS